MYLKPRLARVNVSKPTGEENIPRGQARRCVVSSILQHGSHGFPPSTGGNQLHTGRGTFFSCLASHNQHVAFG
jgi:hypothetical protein